MPVFDGIPSRSVFGWVAVVLALVPLPIVLFGFIIRTYGKGHPTCILGLLGTILWIFAVVELAILHTALWKCDNSAASIAFHLLNHLSLMCLYGHLLAKARLLNVVPGTWTWPQKISAISIGCIPIFCVFSIAVPERLHINGICFFYPSNTFMAFRVPFMIAISAIPAVLFILGMSNTLQARHPHSFSTTSSQFSQVDELNGQQRKKSWRFTAMLVRDAIFHPCRVGTIPYCGGATAASSASIPGLVELEMDSISTRDTTSRTHSIGASPVVAETNKEQQSVDLALLTDKSHAVADRALKSPISLLPVDPHFLSQSAAIQTSSSSTSQVIRPVKVGSGSGNWDQTSRRLVRLLRRCVISTVLSFMTMVIVYTLVGIRVLAQQDSPMLLNVELSLSWALAIWMLPLPGEERDRRSRQQRLGKWRSKFESASHRFMVFLHIADSHEYQQHERELSFYHSAQWKNTRRSPRSPGPTTQKEIL